MNAETLPPSLPGCGACGCLLLRPVHSMLTEDEAKLTPGLSWASQKARFLTEYYCRSCGSNRTREWRNLYGT